MTHLSTQPRQTAAPASPASSATSYGRRLLWLGPTGIVVAVGLSVVEWLVVTAPDNNGSAAAGLLALTMTLPVVLARRFPVAAAALVSAAAVLNGLVFDDVVRCAGAFPAAVYIAFAVGARTRENGRGWAWTGVGFATVVAGLIAQWVWDPALNTSTDFLPFGLGLALAACAAGIGWSVLARRVLPAASGRSARSDRTE